MDGFSAAGTAIDLVEKAVKLYKYCRDVRNAPKAIEEIKQEVLRVKELLKLLNERLEATSHDDPGHRQFLHLQESGVLEDVRTFFAETEKSLSFECANEDTGLRAKLRVSFKKALKLAAWPLKEAETQELLQKLHRLSTQLNGMVQFAHVDISVATYKKTDDILEKADNALEKNDAILEIVARQDLQKKQDDFQKLLDWISTGSSALPKKQGDHEILVPADWLMNDEVFMTWKQGMPWTLTLVADAGYGKSVLSSFILRHLRDESIFSSDLLVLSVFLRYEDQKTQTVQSLLSVLLRQVVAHLGLDCIPEEIENAWSKRQSDDSFSMDLGAIRAALNECLGDFEKTYIVVDGLDECTDTVRVGLLSELRSLQSNVQEARHGYLSLLLTSRPIKDTREPSIIRCNKCKTSDLRIYFICPVEQIHGKDYALCRPCALETMDCEGEPHHLHEPYTNIDWVLRPPDSVITDLIEQLIARERSFGFDTSEQTRAHVEAGWTKEDTSAQTSLGRALRDREKDDLGKQIIQAIVERANGSFLLAQMQFEHLRSLTRPSDVARKLATLPREFNSMYASAMERIDRQKYDHKELGRKTIMWLSHVQRVVSFDELQHALSVDIEAFKSPERDDSEAEADARVFSKSDLIYQPLLLEVTVGLVDLSLDGMVRLMHRSAYEYFSDPEVRKKWFPDADSQIASACIAYLSHTETKTSCSGEEDEEMIKDRLVALPFAGYAAQYWGDHVRLSQSDPNLLAITETFVRSREKLASATQISYFCEYYNPSGWDVRKGVSALHVLSWYGIDKLLQKFVTPDHPVDQVDASDYGRTALHWACKGGHAQAIASLIELGTDLNMGEQNRRNPSESLTALTRVAKEGHEEACQKLCERDELNVNATASNGLSALMFACKSSQPRIIDVLCERPDIQLDYRNEDGGTALMMAAATDSRATIRSLLKHKDKGMDLDQIDDGGYTALHHAAWKGKRENAHELVEAGANINARSLDGETPVWFAVNFKHKDVVEDFWEHKEFTHEMTVDDKGDGLLASACYTGVDSLVTWLLDRRFDPNVADINDVTPLHVASRKGFESIARTLIERGATRDPKTRNGQTPADFARSQQHDDLAKYLDPDITDDKLSQDELPAMALASQGLEEALRHRLEIEGPSAIQDVDFDGNTALHLAVKNKHIGCVRAILEHVKDEEILNKVNSWQRTPLHTAGWFNSPASIELLLAQDPQPDLDALDIAGHTALRIAIDRGDDRSAIMLIEAGADMRAGGAKMEHMLLEAAIDRDNLPVAEKLVRAGVEVRYADIRRAKLKGKAEMMRLLRRHQTWDARSEPSQQASLSLSQSQSQSHNASEVGMSKESTLNSSGSTSSGLVPHRLLTAVSDAETIADGDGDDNGGDKNAVCASPEDLKHMESLLPRADVFGPPLRTDTLQSLDFPKAPAGEPDVWDLDRLKAAFKLLESPTDGVDRQALQPNARS